MSEGSWCEKLYAGRGLPKLCFYVNTARLEPSPAAITSPVMAASLGEVRNATT